MNESETIALIITKARRTLASVELLRKHGDYDAAVSRLYYVMLLGAGDVSRRRTRIPDPCGGHAQPSDNG